MKPPGVAILTSVNSDLEEVEPIKLEHIDSLFDNLRGEEKVKVSGPFVYSNSL